MKILTLEEFGKSCKHYLWVTWISNFSFNNMHVSLQSHYINPIVQNRIPHTEFSH